MKPSVTYCRQPVFHGFTCMRGRNDERLWTVLSDCQGIGSIRRRWTNLVIRELAAGSESFNDLRKGVPLMSPSLLSTRLKSLEKGKVIERKQKNGHVSYKLTKAGEELIPIIFQLGTWGHRWVRSDLSTADLDPSLLIWDMHRSLKVDYFKGGRTVIKIEFTGQSAKYRHWWLVIKDGDVDVCLKDPGHEVDLMISSDLRTLTASGSVIILL